MIVGIDAHALGSGSSGNETYYEQLLRHLANNNTNENRYVIYYTRPTAVAQIPTTEKFHLKRISPAGPFWRIPVAFPLEFRRQRLDLFHAQFIIPPICKCKTVTTIPDIAYEHYPQFFSRFETFRSKVLIRRSAKRADHILTVSNFSKDDLVKTYGIDPSKITVTYEGAGHDYFPQDKMQSREQIALRYGVRFPFLLYVGRLQERKNLRRLLSAYARLRKQGTQHKLVLVGKKDWTFTSIQAHVKALGLESSVVFTGYVPTQDLPLFYNAADVFVYPSIFEGFGLPVMEAMACGLPVLTSYGSSLEEISGGAAILVDPFSEESITTGLGKLLGDNSLRSRLSHTGLERSTSFSFEKTARQTLEVYEKVAGSSV